MTLPVVSLPAGEQAATLLAVLRTGAGVAAWLTPGIVERIYGAPADGGAPLRFALRTFGARDMAMGAAMFSAGQDERQRWLALGLAVDAADGAAAVIAGIRRQLPAPVAALITLTAGGAVVLGLRARQP